MNYILLTTTACPKCPEFKQFVVDNVTFEGVLLDETNPEFTNRIAELGVTAAPTMVIFEDEKEIFRTSETYELQDFLAKQ
ncbi:MAG: hypothetical protein OEL89_03990 [Candidatus Peregrinibacteria bacterium]|nr:hypothetical protein [Candidatus Peregrinibacteria bacterium]